jgi:hypothetical protein
MKATGVSGILSRYSAWIIFRPEVNRQDIAMYRKYTSNFSPVGTLVSCMIMTLKEWYPYLKGLYDENHRLFIHTGENKCSE